MFEQGGVLVVGIDVEQGHVLVVGIDVEKAVTLYLHKADVEATCHNKPRDTAVWLGSLPQAMVGNPKFVLQIIRILVGSDCLLSGS